MIFIASNLNEISRDRFDFNIFNKFEVFELMTFSYQQIIYISFYFLQKKILSKYFHRITISSSNLINYLIKKLNNLFTQYPTNTEPSLILQKTKLQQNNKSPEL